MSRSFGFGWLLVAGFCGGGGVLFGGDEALFREVPVAESGIDGGHTLDEEGRMAFLNVSGFGSGGVFLGDVDGNGLADVYMSDGGRGGRLWMNGGEMRFEEKVGAIEGKDDFWRSGAALVDIDGDGDLDLFQCQYRAPNQLFLNDGKGEFAQVVGAAGLDFEDASLSPYFADADGDGDLDVFVLCNRLYREGGRPAKMPLENKGAGLEVKEEFRKYYRLRPKPGGGLFISDYGRRDYLFLNDGLDGEGNLKFRDVSEASGACMEGNGLSAVWWDFDGDGDMDLHVSNDFNEPDRLFRNDGVNDEGVPIFKDVAGDVYPSTAWFSMGSGTGDFNNDGLVDLVTVDMSSSSHFKAKTSMGSISAEDRELMLKGWPKQHMRNHLYLNTGKDFFQEAAYASGVASTNWSWAVKVGDFDQDGWEDLYFCNGMIRNFANADWGERIGDLQRALIGKTEWELYKASKPLIEKNVAYRNLGGQKFKEKDAWGLGLVGMSYSAATGDLDGDGDLDMVVSDLGKRLRVYENGAALGTGLLVRLRGVKGDGMAVGARVILRDSAGVERVRWMNPWRGYASQDDAAVHFGLGDAVAEELVIDWPSGVRQVVAVEKGKRVIMVEEAGEIKVEEKGLDGRFVQVAAPERKHVEAYFDDFAKQPLIPSQHSQLGPCLAVGDVDGDGDEDLFVGGGNGQAGSLLLNEGGKFAASEQEVFGGLARYADDLGAVFFDADGDGDLDLYVARGGSEFEAGDLVYRDSLFLNETKGGKVVFVDAAEGALPDVADSGSCVAAADYDGDGDLDLFVGSGLVPWKYPTKPENRLLRNDGGKFVDVAPEGLRGVGMVRDGAGGDVDGDGDVDLVVGVEWGAVSIFLNDGGKLALGDVGMGGLRGWWKAIELVDVDGDGDLDVMAGNAGVNTKYKKPSSEKPLTVYYGDMDGSGVARIVEAKRGKDVHGRERPLPVRGRY